MALTKTSDVGASHEWATRPEHPHLLLGRGNYVGDVDREGQLFLVVVRSSEAHGAIRRVDVDEARRAPGVHAVLTAGDLLSVPHLPLRTPHHPEYLPFTEPVLADGRVRYVGQPLAVVVADSPQLAEDATELVDVEVEASAVTTKAWQPAESPLWPGVSDNVASTIHAADGDVDAVFASADVVVSTELAIGRDTGMPMETRGLVAEWSDDGRLHLWGPTKIVPFVRRAVADLFDVPPEAVTCHRVDVGGMFGPRGELYPEDFLVPWAAAVVQRPVKWVEDRREHFLSINHSREQRYLLEIAATRDGRLLGMRADIWVDMGAFVRPVAWRVPEGTVEHLPGPYPWDAVSIRCRAVCTNKTPAGTMRGPTSYETTFARERALDVLADQLGIDPVEVRRKNLIAPDAMPYQQDLGDELAPVIYDSGDYLLVLDGMLATAGLDQIRADVERRRNGGELVGHGVACFLGHSGLGPDETVRLELTAGGEFRVTTSASEIGQNLTSMVAKVLENELGKAAARPQVLTGEVGGGGTGTFASRSTMQVGGALVDACRQLRAIAAERSTEAGHDGRLDDAASWTEVAPIAVQGHHRIDEPTYGFGAHLAVVSVDADTGELSVERIVVAFDCGRAIDPAAARAQLEGAAVQGLAGAAYAELPFDDAGQPLVTTFMNYLMPTVTETPPIDVLLYELPGVTGNRLAAKGVGEAGTIGVGGAIANAVSAALGQADAIRELPVKPDSVAPWLPPWPAERAAEERAPQPGQSTLSGQAHRVLVGVGVGVGVAVMVGVRLLRRRRRAR